MKTIEQLKKNMTDYMNGELDGVFARKFDEEVRQYRFLIQYLDCSPAPTESMLKEQKERVKRLLEIATRPERYKQWIDALPGGLSQLPKTKLQKMYRDKNEIGKLKKQIETLDYLID